MTVTTEFTAIPASKASSYGAAELEYLENNMAQASQAKAAPVSNMNIESSREVPPLVAAPPPAPTQAAPAAAPEQAAPAPEAPAPTAPPVAAKPEEDELKKYLAGVGGRSDFNTAQKLVSGLSDADRNLISKDFKLPNLEQKLTEAKAEYDQRVEQMGKSRALASMFSLFGHLAVGLYGIKHGVDTSGVKFDTTDWAANYHDIMERYKMDRAIQNDIYEATASRRQKILDSIAKAGESDVRAREASTRDQLGTAGLILSAQTHKATVEAGLATKAAQDITDREHLLDTASQKIMAPLVNADFKLKGDTARNALAEKVAASLPQAGILPQEEWNALHPGWLSSATGGKIGGGVSGYDDYVAYKAMDYFATEKKNLRSGPVSNTPVATQAAPVVVSGRTPAQQAELDKLLLKKNASKTNK